MAAWRRKGQGGRPGRLTVRTSAVSRQPIFIRISLLADGAGCPVKFKQLLESWQQGATGERTAAAYSVRLPIDDAARLHALAEMYPGRTREQLITDLLSAALQEVAAAMPYVPGKKVISTDDQGDPVYEDAGPTPRFMELARRNRKKLEAELKKS